MTESPSQIVYVLTNPAMLGLVKIGKTTQLEVEDRMKQLFSTGVPVPFDCAFACQVNDAAEAERALEAGGALIASDAQLSRLPPGVRERLVKLAQWRRIPGYLPEERAWRSWRDRDPEAVYEGMSIVALHDGKDTPFR